MKCSVEKPFQEFVSHIQRNNLTQFELDRLGAKKRPYWHPSFYLIRGERQPIRLFFSNKQTRKITAEFHKVTPVKPFIDCLISCHLTLTKINANL